jgi:hypothetical protein
MIEEFDKEMDVLLRQAAQGETAFEDSGFKIQDSRLSHLDADEISLFAENALPKKLRENAVLHFADCDRCRRILSALISQQTENEIVSAKQSEVFAPVVPWYRKFFAFPNLAYTLGALVLVFSGVVAFAVLQSVNNSQNADISQVSEQLTKGGPFLDDTAIVTEQSANTMASSNMSNATMSNTSTSNDSMSNATSTSSSGAMMSNASINSAARNSNSTSTSNSSTAANKSSVSENDSPKDETRSDVTVTQQLVTELPLQARNAKNLTEEKTERAKKEDKNDTVSNDMAKAAPPPKPAQPSVSETEVTSSDTTSAKSKRMERLQSVETTSVGGKTFKRAGNSWVDSAYKGQATTNITRGTKEFKKLDSDLRRIAQNLGGTVIIVWKDKAYRIQ